MLVGRADTFSLSIEEEDSAGVMKLKILRPFAAVSPPRPSQTNCALKQIRQWLVDRDRQVFLLHGFAGTGKTTLAVKVGQMVGPTAFAALTGKATSRLVEAGAPREETSTLHRLLFRSTWDEIRKRFTHSPREPYEFAHLALIIVDEASMVGETMARHLLATRRPLLIVGDPFQLPPVADGSGPFMVERPDALLTEVYRQARDNPILRVATAIREGTSWRRHVDGDRVRLADCWDDSDAPDILVCGTNNTRWRTNSQLPAKRSFVSRTITELMHLCSMVKPGESSEFVQQTSLERRPTISS